jgi:glycosyltransferase involved in cell wall biosynthesis
MELLARSHILLHASVKEGWGLVVLEAGSQWTPSVVYGVGGLVDTVKDGKTGIIVPSCDPHDLAKAVLSLYADRSKFALMQKQAMMWSNTFHWGDVIKESRALIAQAYETYYR